MASPWEGDAVPVRDAPLTITWESESNDDSPPPMAEPSSDSRRWIAGGVVFFVLVLAAGFVWQPGDDGDEADAPAPPLDTLPAPEPIETAELDEPTPNDDTDTESVSPVSGGGPSAPGSPVEFTGDLPAFLSELDAPTELIVQASDGMLHTLSLPSGTVRSFETGFGDTFGPGMVVSDDAVLLSTYERGSVIVPRTGLPVELDAADFGVEFDDSIPFRGFANPIGWIDTETGSSAFLVGSFSDSPDQQSIFGVTLDGDATPVKNPWPGLAEPVFIGGAQVVNDAGGVYRLDDGAARLISPGRVIGSSDDELLVRTCDERLECAASIMDFDGENVRLVDLPAELSDQSRLALSPDGSAVSFVRYDQEPTQVIVAFDGTTSETSTNPGGGGFRWAADSSGVYALGQVAGLVFIDRVTGEVTEFAQELGRLNTLGVRFPDSELVNEADAVTRAPITLSAPFRSPTGIELAVLSDIGSLSIVDLDAATATSWITRRITGSAAPRVFDLGDRLLATSGNGALVSVASPGSSTDISDDVSLEPPFAIAPGGSGIWMRRADADQPIDQVVVDPGRAAPSDAAVRVLDGAVLGDDGFGWLVFESSGDVYASDGVTVTPLTSGVLLAVSATDALVRECDAPSSCVTRLVDRATGEPRPVSDSLPDAVAAGLDRSVSLAGSLSPDGRFALVEVTTNDADGSPGTTWLFIDLVDGTFVPAGAPDDDQPIVWNEASTHAAFVSDEIVTVFEVSTRSLVEVDVGGDVRAIGRTDGEFAAP